ncbi:hypothetical protein F511_05297 [Dorcoceras hygrometricum]|uniref:Uncharacterized protein n=1 Tax=Dorcoceras hygrometricum TaxID=472368 RepID=A0A2Z7BXT5_9LAMI|nr:hypothetical protein F511_05297 [Dorcoceras hygrometricum]
MSIEMQSDFSKGKSGNISSDELTDCASSFQISQLCIALVHSKAYSDSRFHYLYCMISFLQILPAGPLAH